MKKYLLLLFVSQSLLFSQEILPDPAKLDTAWWETFSKNDKREETTEKFIKTLENIPESLPAENQAEARTLLKDIDLHFKKWINTPSLPLPKSPSTIKPYYTIEELVALWKQIQKLKEDLEDKKKDLTTAQNELQSLTKRLDEARLHYFNAELRSPEKIIEGLKLFSLRPFVESVNNHIKFLGREIENTNIEIGYLTDEINEAKKRLISQKIESLSFERNIEDSRKNLASAQEALQKAQFLYAQKRPEENTRKAEILNYHLLMNTVQAAINEAEAEILYIQNQLLFMISQLLVEPQRINLEKLDVTIKEWKEKITQYEKNISEWRAQSERIANRLSQMLTIKSGELAEDQGDIAKILKLSQDSSLHIRGLNNDLKETDFLLTTLSEKSIIIRGEGARWLQVFLEFISGSWNHIRDQFDRTLFYLGEKPIRIWNITQFILIMIATWWISKLITRALDTIVATRKGIRKAVVYRLNRLLHYFLLFVGLLIALTWLGFDFSNFVLLAGALGVGIGFGLQNIFNDFLSGVIILFQSHLKVGDFVEIGPDLKGEIREINVRNTILSTNDGTDILVPNSEMVSKKVINWTLRDPYRRIHVPFSVAYGTDLEEVSRIITDSAKKVPSTLNKIGVRDPQVFISKLGESGIEMELVVWVDEKWNRRTRNSQSQYLFMIERTLKKYDIEIPYARLDVRIKDILGKKTIDDSGETTESDK